MFKPYKKQKRQTLLCAIWPRATLESVAQFTFYLIGPSAFLDMVVGNVRFRAGPSAPLPLGVLKAL